LLGLGEAIEIADGVFITRLHEEDEELKNE
jgi:hypothetical protein